MSESHKHKDERKKPDAKKVYSMILFLSHSTRGRLFFGGLIANGQGYDVKPSKVPNKQ